MPLINQKIMWREFGRGEELEVCTREKRNESLLKLDGIHAYKIEMETDVTVQ